MQPQLLKCALGALFASVLCLQMAFQFRPPDGADQPTPAAPQSRAAVGLPTLPEGVTTALPTLRSSAPTAVPTPLHGPDSAAPPIRQLAAAENEISLVELSPDNGTVVYEVKHDQGRRARLYAVGVEHGPPRQLDDIVVYMGGIIS